MQNRNILIKKYLYETPDGRGRAVGKMNGTAVTNRLHNSFKIT
jgi:hypothetical protein